MTKKDITNIYLAQLESGQVKDYKALTDHIRNLQTALDRAEQRILSLSVQCENHQRMAANATAKSYKRKLQLQACKCRPHTV